MTAERKGDAKRTHQCRVSRNHRNRCTRATEWRATLQSTLRGRCFGIERHSIS